MKTIQIAHSCKQSREWLKEKPSVSFIPDVHHHEMQMVMVYNDLHYQTIEGFGGSFTPSSAEVFDKMNEEKQQEILKLLFTQEGLNYNCGRMVMGSCDFSRGGYTYCDKENDIALESFSIAEDEKAVIPFLLRGIQTRGDKLSLLASPWSPPAWMKTNHQLFGGGKLKKEYYPVWADYFVKYLQTYRAWGIDIQYITVQNEPNAVQKWESCLYSAEEEKVFVRDYLYPKLAAASLDDVKIVIWDHNKEQMFERARTIFSDEQARNFIGGVAFHWYSGDHFENIRLCREFFPEKELIFTEGCVELTTTQTSMANKANKGECGHIAAEQSPWEFGECYGHDMIGNFNGGMSRFIDWNLMLDKQGGPNHVGNLCSAPIICDYDKQELLLQPSFCFISHFSRFVPKSSRRVAYSRYTDELEIAAFLTPDNKTIVVVMNPTEKAIPYVLKDVVTQQIAHLVAAPKSIDTLRY